MKIDQSQIYDMSVKESQTVIKQTSISQKLHPGFLCFFRDFLTSKAMTFNECFNQLLEGTLEINQIKYPIQNIMKNKALSLQNKKQLLKTKDDSFLYFYRTGDEDKFQGDLIEQTSKDQESISMLERRLEFYQQNKQKLLNEKLAEINKKKIKEEVEKSKPAEIVGGGNEIEKGNKDNGNGKVL